MQSSSPNTQGVLPTLNRNARRHAPAKPSDWSSSYPATATYPSDSPALSASTTVSYGPAPVHRCPTRIQFSIALDLPHQRRSHQHPAWLSSHYKSGCHCHWASRRTQGRLEGLICDSGPHYYHRSKNGTLIRGPLKPLSHKPLPPLHDRIPASAKPVTWAGHDVKAQLLPIPPLQAPVQHPNSGAHKAPVPVLVSKLTNPPEKQTNNATKKPVGGGTQHTPEHETPKPLAFLARPAAPKAVNSSAQVPTNRQTINIPITGSTQPSPNTQTSPNHEAHDDTPVARTGTATSRIEVPNKPTTPSAQAPDSLVTPAPIVPAAAEDAPGSNRQVVYTSTASAMNANTTPPATNPTIDNSNTLSSNNDNNFSVPPVVPANDSLAKALGGTFAGIIGLSLILIAAVLLGRRRTARPRESFAGLRRSRHSSIVGPPAPAPQMIQIPAPIGASPHQTGHRTALMSPADPETRYSSNGTGLLTKLQGTTASLQRAGLITPSGSLEGTAADPSNAAETIVGVAPVASRSSPSPFADLRNPDRGSVGTQPESIYNPFANEQSISSDHHFAGSRRQSLATDLSYPNGSGGANMSSGEIEAVRFGSSPNSDVHLPRPESRAGGPGVKGSGDVEQAWWGGA